MNTLGKIFMASGLMIGHGAAARTVLGSVFHARSGYLYAKVDRPPINAELSRTRIADSIASAPIFDFEYEVFFSNRISTVLRYVLALDLSTTKNVFSSTGLGQRYYFFSKGPVVERADEGVFVGSTPTWRFFAGWNVSISQLAVGDFGTLLQLNSTMFDVGGLAGLTYSINSKLSVEAVVDGSFGYGFSTVPVNALMFKACAGISANF